MFNPFKLNYDKPGRGVSENEPDKKGIFKYFDIIIHKIKELLMLNILFIITSIPIVTIGPSFAAMTDVLKSYIDGEHSWGISDYFSAFKKHFRRGFFTGIAALLFGYGILHNLIYFVFLSEGLVGAYLTWLFIALAVLYIIVHGYVYTLLVTTRESVLELYTDAFILTLAKLPLNIVVSAATMLYPALIIWIFFTPAISVYISTPLASTLVLFTLFSFCQLSAVLYTGSVIKKIR